MNQDFFSDFPYSNSHTLNLDWILEELRLVAEQGDRNEARLDMISPDLTSPYITPEYYGAIGDGVADDTRPINEAIQSGKTVVGMGTYLTEGPIQLDKSGQMLVFNTILHQGAGSAIEVKSGAIQLIVNTIRSMGDGIELIGNSNSFSTSPVYCNIHFANIFAYRHGIVLDDTKNTGASAIMLNTFYGGNVVANRYDFDHEPSAPKGDCIHIVGRVGNGVYINNNKFIGMSLYRGVKGISMETTSPSGGDFMTSNVFDDVSVEDASFSTHAVYLNGVNNTLLNVCVDEITAPTKNEFANVLGVVHFNANSNFPADTLVVNLAGRYNSAVIIRGNIRNGPSMFADELIATVYGTAITGHQDITQVVNGKLDTTETAGIPGIIISADYEAHPDETTRTVQLKYANAGGIDLIPHQITILAN